MFKLMHLHRFRQGVNNSVQWEPIASIPTLHYSKTTSSETKRLINFDLIATSVLLQITVYQPSQ